MENNKKQQKEKSFEEKILEFLKYVYNHTSKGYVLINLLNKTEEGKTLPEHFNISGKHTLNFLKKFGVIEFDKYKKKRVCTWISDETPEKILPKYLEFYRIEQREYDKKRQIKKKEEANKNQTKLFDDEIIPSELHDDIVYSLKNNFIDQDENDEKNNKTDLIEVLNTLNKNIINLNKTLEKIIAIEKEKHEITD